MNDLINKVEALMREVAEEELLSRFGKLQRHEIVDKYRPGDVVTTADLEAEVRLSEGLLKLHPASTVIGEEDAYRNPEILDRLKGDVPVWTIDPLDGTGNFAKGKPCFAMICALIEGGVTQIGWILDPVAGVCIQAQRGQGVFLNQQRLNMRQPETLESMTGSVGDGLRKRLQTRQDRGEAGLPRQFLRYHCCGREYLDLLLGKIDFALYGGRLMPWDHAAGALMIAEAGGYVGMCDGDEPYAPQLYDDGNRLMLAPNRRAFDDLQSVLFSEKGA